MVSIGRIEYPDEECPVCDERYSPLESGEFFRETETDVTHWVKMCGWSPPEEPEITVACVHTETDMMEVNNG